MSNNCEKCGSLNSVKLAYIFNMLVTDGSESMWVNVIGDQGDALLKEPAEKLKQMKDAGNKDYEKVFDKILMEVIFGVGR